MSELRQFTWDEIKNTNPFESTLLVIDNKVYDVRHFLERHPGGREVLIERSGKEATDDFDSVDHSEAALDMVDEFLVGEIVENEQIDHYNGNEDDAFTLEELFKYIPLAVFLGLLFYYVWTNLV